MTFVFEDAIPEAEKARIALDGPSGSGKTWTALRIAQGLGGTIGVIDTEHRSATKYGRYFQFKRVNVSHYDPRQLIQAIAAAAQQGIDVLVIDSLTHFWSGKGGVLSLVDQASKESYRGNSFGGWKDVRPIEADMLDAILSFPGHVIVTLRVKTDYQIEEKNGKKVPVKVGLKPDQRDGLDYEFDIVGSLDQAHTMTITKSRVVEVPVGAAFENPGEEFGEIVASWLADGVEVPSALQYRDMAVEPGKTYRELLDLYGQVERANLLRAAVFDDAGNTTPLGELIERKGTEAKQREQGAVQQPSRQQPTQRQTRLAGAPANAGTVPAAEPGPDDKALVAAYTHRIAQAADADTLDAIEADLKDAAAGGGVSDNDKLIVWRALEQRRQSLGLPYGQPRTPAAHGAHA